MIKDYAKEALNPQSNEDQLLVIKSHIARPSTTLVVLNKSWVRAVAPRAVTSEPKPKHYKVSEFIPFSQSFGKFWRG